MSSDLGAGDGRADALLKEQKISDEEKRSACVTLASLALTAAGGDRRAAKPMLRQALEVIGVIAYRPAAARKHFGQAREA
jgi:hypothetical protein